VLRRSVKAPLVLLVFACGVLLSAALNHGGAGHDEGITDSVPLETPTISIESGRERLAIRGMSESTAHELALLRLAADHFAKFETRADFTAGVILAKNWDSTSSRLLYALAAMDSAKAVMREDSISIRGVTSDARTFASRLEFLRENLLDHVLVDTNVITIELAAMAQPLCVRAFSQLVLGPVSFKISSAEIRSASLVTLDRITEFAHDCQTIAIAITGHTDTSGDEFWNRTLSLSRAQAVADRLVARGIDPTRLIVAGRGSSEPLGDNATARGRDLNRRIEFALR